MTSEKLVLGLKMNGINLELMGAVRAAAATPEAKSLVLREIVARVLKNDLYDDLRDLADASDKVVFSACAEKLNFFFKTSKDATVCSSSITPSARI